MPIPKASQQQKSDRQINTITIHGIIWLWAALLGISSMWIVFEQDIYWQIRAGVELWQTWHWPTTDNWSYTVPGGPWINVQWLSTLLFAGIYQLGAEPALSIARVLLITCLLGLAGEILYQGWSKQRDAAPLWQVGLTTLGSMPALYLVLWPRLQLRSDTLVVLIFASYIWWCHRQPEHWRSNNWVGVACILLATNLHSGTAPFVVLAHSCLLLASPQAWSVKGWFLGLGSLAFFVQPYPLACLRFLWQHLRYETYNLIPNLDHQQLHIGYVHWQLGGWPGLAWIILCAASLLIFLLARRSRWLMPSYWHGGQEQCWPMLLGVFVLTCLCINRVRAIPYQMFFILPLFATSLPHWPIVMTLSNGLMSHYGAYAFLRSLTLLWGFGVHEGLFPKRAAAFLAEHKPQANIYHTFAMGSYIVWALRDYKLYVDARETMYIPLQQEIIASSYNSKLTAALMEKYNINTVLIPTPVTKLLPNGFFEDTLGEFFPKATWALVAFDHAASVLLRRIPAHQALISQYEYQLLQPNLPANWYPLRAERTLAKDQQFLRELQQCTTQSPDNTYCAIAQASWWRMQGEQTQLFAAINLLERIQPIAVRWNSPHTLTLMVELAALYKGVGRVDKAFAIEASLGQPSTPPQQLGTNRLQAAE